MFSMFNLAIFDSIVSFLESVSGTLQYEYLLYVLAGIFLMFAIMIFIKTRFSYEVRAIRGFKKINKYFMKKPYINETNLVEFNKKMKKLPYQLRDRWQYFMLNREGLPSSYMTLYHCVEQPIKTSTYNFTVTLAKSIASIITVIGFILGLLVASGESLTVINLARAFAGPIIFYLLSEIFIMLLRNRFKNLSTDLYEYFILFTKNLDKASVSIPDYVDYELLFTSREIREGIPVLREYLEKKALLEQVALQKAKANLEEREKFDFSKYGIDGSLVLERAMETAQDYLNNRRRLKEEITKLEQEKEKDDETYVNAEKDAQKKLQAIKENLDKMQALMEESANRIEQNYIKKQQAEEIKKREQINKDLEDLRLKYAQEVQFLDAEIAKRKEEIANGKLEVENSMDSEFETYAQKVFVSIKNQLEEDKADEFALTKQELARTKEIVEKDEQRLENNIVEMELKDQQIDTLKSEYERVSQDLEKFVKTDKRGVKELYRQNADMQSKIQSMRDMIVNLKKQNNQTIYFDENGNFIDFDTFKDKKGQYKVLPKVYDLNGNFIDFGVYYNKNGELLPDVEKAPVLGNYLPDNYTPFDIAAENQIAQDVNVVQNDDKSVEAQVEEAPIKQDENIVQDDAVDSDEPVYYDEQGNVVDFAQYYNDDGSFKEFPKVYDADGNYYDFADYYDVYGNPLYQENDDQENLIEETEEPHIEEQTQPIIDESEVNGVAGVEDILSESVEQEETPIEASTEDAVLDSQNYDSEDVVYYDEQGNVVDFEQYYNEDGSFKEFPKVYDAEGNYYDFADYYDIYGNLLNQEQESQEVEADAKIEEAILSESQQESEKRKRGRPRKVKTEEELNKPKRKRGRPRKNEGKAETIQGQENKQEEQKEKKKVGRPKKTDQEELKTRKRRMSRETGDNDNSSIQTGAKRGRGRPRKNPEKKKVDDLDELELKINEETEKLNKQQSELKSQISQTLSELQSTNASDSNLSDLKEIVAKLKKQANEAKKNGLSKEEQQKINKSLAELLRAMAQKK